MEYYLAIAIVEFHHRQQYNGTGGCYIKRNQSNMKSDLMYFRLTRKLLNSLLLTQKLRGYRSVYQ